MAQVKLGPITTDYDASIKALHDKIGTLQEPLPQDFTRKQLVDMIPGMMLYFQCTGALPKNEYPQTWSADVLNDILTTVREPTVYPRNEYRPIEFSGFRVLNMLHKVGTICQTPNSGQKRRRDGTLKHTDPARQIGADAFIKLHASLADQLTQVLMCMVPIDGNGTKLAAAHVHLEPNYKAIGKAQGRLNQEAQDLVPIENKRYIIWWIATAAFCAFADNKARALEEVKVNARSGWDFVAPKDLPGMVLDESHGMKQAREMREYAAGHDEEIARLKQKNR